MRRRLQLALLSLLWLIIPATSRAQAPEDEAARGSPPAEEEGERTLVAVLFLASSGVDPTLAENLTEVLVAQVASSGRFAIVGREQFGRVIGVGGEDETLRCTEDPVCLGRIGALIGAEEIVLGSLGERAGRYLVNLSRLDVTRAQLVHRVFRTLPAELSPLIEAVGESAAELMQPPPGAAHVTVNVEDHQLLVDGEEVSPDPDGVLRNLEPGEHTLTVRAPGYGEAVQPFEVTRGQTLELSINLSREIRVVERAAPWYRRWWIWTILGVVVAGAGATTAIVLTQDTPETASGTLGTIRFP